MVGRLGDGLVLAASLEDEAGSTMLLEPQTQAKRLLRTLSYTSPARASLDAPPYLLHYLIELDVIYIAICDAHVSQERAFTYLQQVAQEFSAQYGDRVKEPTRPYSFIEFDTTLQKLRRSGGGRRRVAELDKKPQEVQHILRDNINHVLESGMSLSDLEGSSSRVSQKYRGGLKNSTRRCRFYAKTLVVLLILLILLYWSMPGEYFIVL